MLEVNGLAAGYQGNDVVHDIAFHVDPGEAVMIIGSNGAGKTTLFRSMIGFLRPSSGEVRFEETDITGMPAQLVVRLGIVFVPAERHLFPRMTVEENLSLGAYPNRPDRETMAMVMDLFPRLTERMVRGYFLACHKLDSGKRGDENIEDVEQRVNRFIAGSRQIRGQGGESDFEEVGGDNYEHEDTACPEKTVVRGTGTPIPRSIFYHRFRYAAGMRGAVRMA